jgi:hypothetical protein
MLTQDHLYGHVEACCANSTALCSRVCDNESYELVIYSRFELVSVRHAQQKNLSNFFDSSVNELCLNTRRKPSNLFEFTVNIAQRHG